MIMIAPTMPLRAFEASDNHRKYNVLELDVARKKRGVVWRELQAHVAT